jgi:hypothetical protein
MNNYVGRNQDRATYCETVISSPDYGVPRLERVSRLLNPSMIYVACQSSGDLK